MTPSDSCLKLTESSEGCKLKAYQDTGGVWTIGYGHTGGVLPNSIITQEMAETLLKHDMQYAAQIVNAHAVPCTQGQFDALTDFVFNVGPTQFLGSHLFTYHKLKEYEKAAAEFPKWKYDNGKIEPGLVTRRAAEQALYIRQEPEAIRPHTDELGRSDPPVSAPGQVPSVAPPSPVPPAPASGTAAGSDSSGSEFLSQAWALVSKLLKRG